MAWVEENQSIDYWLHGAQDIRISDGQIIHDCCCLPGLDKEFCRGYRGRRCACSIGGNSYRAMIAPEESSHHEPLKCLIQNPVTLAEVPTRLEKAARLQHRLINWGYAICKAAPVHVDSVVRSSR